MPKCSQIAQNRGRFLAENAPCAGKAESDGQDERRRQRSGRHARQHLPWQAHDAGDHEPCRDAAGQKRKQGRRRAKDQIFQREGSDEHGACRAEHFQHDGVMHPGAVAGGERAAKHEDGGDQRDRRRGAGCGLGSSLLRRLDDRLRGAEGAPGGVDVLGLGRRSHARLIGYVPQSGEVPFDLTVREAVLLGRTPHFGIGPGRADWAKVDEAIALLGLGELEDRSLSELSGGQAQRALVARALAQDTRVLLLDEPTSALDLRYQIETLQLVRQITRSHGITALIAIHDLNHAGRFCDQAVLLHQGRIQRAGTPQEAFDEAALTAIYGLDVTVEEREGYVEVRPVVREIEYQI